VLPIGATLNGVTVVNDATRVPMLDRTAGWFTTGIVGVWTMQESVVLNFGVENLLDRNYRTHGSGVDMPGINAFAGIRWIF
jgi:outer membrane receptor protein involved in Fe transport